jgi:hypothetical protein
MFLHENIKKWHMQMALLFSFKMQQALINLAGTRRPTAPSDGATVYFVTGNIRKKSILSYGIVTSILNI